MKYVTGTPSLEESRDCWKADLNEPNLEDGEYYAACEALSEHLELRYPRGEWPPDLYVRGDCFGDTTAAHEVRILAIGVKDRSRLSIGGEEYES